jgi:excisionase family DNA binding protein
MMSVAENLVHEGLFTIAEAQAFAKLSRATLYGLMESGVLAYVKIRRSRRIPRRALIELIQRGLVLREEKEEI